MNTVKDYAKFIGSLLISFALYYFTTGILTTPERKGLLVLTIATSLWLTQPIPLAATALLIPIAQVLLGVQKLEPAITPFFDPVILLLLGGFLLAVMVEKYELDKYVAQKIVSNVEASARRIILILMFTTSVLSMWISNTASTALMMPLVMKLCQGTGEEDGNFAKISVLSIAYSATAGGLGSVLGTTTPAMAVSSVGRLTGYEIGFLEWMIFGAPVSLLMVLVIWMLVFKIFPTEVTDLSYRSESQKRLDSEQKTGVAIFFIAVIMWITGKIPGPIASLIGWSGHGLGTAMVSGIVAILLFLTGLLDSDDISEARWSTMLLIGGSLSLGSSMSVSGLDNRISELLIPLTNGMPIILTLFLVGFFGLGISIIASNTASAGIILPIAISLGKQTGIDPIILGILVGVTTSLDFMLPVGTPPNAIAYSSDKVEMRDMIKAGVLLDISGIIIAVLLAYFLWPTIIG
mgnify:CR=1 FL=1